MAGPVELESGERNMSSTSSMSRESKKRQLKRQVVADRPAPQEEDSQELLRRARRRSLRRRMIIAAAVFAVLAVAAILFWHYNTYQSFTEYQVVWETDLTAEQQEAAAQGEGSFCAYADFAGGVLKYTKDGASYIDSRGKVIWIQSYEMKNPMVAVNGDYAAIGDQQGNSIYICNTSGLQGQADTLLPILRVTVSAKGVVAALQEDSRASYIYLYRKDGSSLDISVKSVLSSDGYPIALSLSPEGTQLVTSYMYLEDGLIKNKLVFYNFGLGKNDPRRVVGIFFPQDLGDAMAGDVRFLDESHVVSFTDQGLQFFSTRVETSPESAKQVVLEGNVRSVACSEHYVGVVSDNTEGSDPYCLEVYRSDGSQVFQKSFSYQYTGFSIDGDLVLLYNDSSCRVYNMAGTEKFNGTFAFGVLQVSEGRYPSTLLIAGAQKIQEIRMQ